VAVVAALVPCLIQQPVFGQGRTQPPPPHGLKRLFRVRTGKDIARLGPQFAAQAQANQTIPLWAYTIVSPVDNKSYTGQMVGRSPFNHGHRTTAISTFLIPVVLTFADTGTVFDPNSIDAPDSCTNTTSVMSMVANSPIFQNADYNMNGVDVGTTQYVDAFQRANFWSAVQGTSYHTVLNGTILSPIAVTVPVANGSTNSGTCGLYGLMEINWWDNLVQTSILPSLASQGVTPGTLPLFIFDSVFEYDTDPSNCCILGYHGSYTPGGVLQTYSINSWDTSWTFGGDISVMTHEVGEWMNDPTGVNPTPAWGNIGQVTGCQTNLEVGDPLTGTLFPSVLLNGFYYSPQELAFFSWYYRQAPSIGTGGMYSDNFTFNTGAGPVCQ
jgi:hypothetical protein